MAIDWSQHDIKIVNLNDKFDHSRFLTGYQERIVKRVDHNRLESSIGQHDLWRAVLRPGSRVVDAMHDTWGAESILRRTLNVGAGNGI
jgi:hypothetical protein